jgi:hypothetical protein
MAPSEVAVDSNYDFTFRSELAGHRTTQLPCGFTVIIVADYRYMAHGKTMLTQPPDGVSD